MNSTINTAIEKLNWLEAIELGRKAIETVLEQDKPNLIELIHIASSLLLPAKCSPNQCAFLAAYQSDKDEAIKTINRWYTGDKPLTDRIRSLVPQNLQHQFLRSLDLRFETLLFLHDPITNAGSLPLLLRGYQELFSTTDRAIDVLDVPNQPPNCSWEQLQDFNARKQGNGPYPAAFVVLKQTHPNIAAALQKTIVAEQASWLDPAVGFLADSFLLALSPHQPDFQELRSRDLSGLEWQCGMTYVFFVIEKKTETFGAVAELRIAPVGFHQNDPRKRRGAGCIYPDPRFAAHVFQINPSFQSGIRNAWKVIRQQRPAAFDQYDFRWSLTILDDLKQPKLRWRALAASLEGTSVTLSFAAALRSTIDAVPLVQHRAPSASFLIPDAGADALEKEPGLDPVGGVKWKALAAKTIDWSTTVDVIRNSITEMVVSEGQKANISLSLLPRVVDTFEEGYQWLSEHGEFIREWKRSCVDQCREFFQKTCFAVSEAEGKELLGAYIPNAFHRLPDEREAEKMPLKIDIQNAPKPVKIERKTSANAPDGEYERILQGRLRPKPQHSKLQYRPVIIAADSGIGKTSWLQYAELAISSADDDRIAIRLESLSLYLGCQSLEELIGKIPKSNAVRKFAAEHSVNVDDVIKTLIANGQCVFLLDALDQADDDWNRLWHLILYLNRCQCIVTMRPATLRDRGAGLGNIQYDKYELQPFSIDDATKYLGPHADELFKRLPKADQETGGLLTIPLILYLIREFLQVNDAGQAKQFDLTSRYTIYRSLLLNPTNGLIRRGMKRLEEHGGEAARVFDLGDFEGTVQKLFQVAFWQLENYHHFDTRLGNDSIVCLFSNFNSFLTDVVFRGREPAVAREALTAINLLTCQGVIEDPKKSPSAVYWRHRSFLEFLGGCCLAELINAPSTKERGVSTIELINNFYRYPKNAYGKPVNLHAQWHWTLRFALGREVDLRKGEGDSLLAESLLRYGEPYVVYHAIAEEHVAIGSELESLCRWLVHWTHDGKDYAKAYDESSQPPKVDVRLASIIATSFQRRFRNGPALPAAYYLLEYTQSQGPTAEVTECIEAAKGNLFQDFMGDAPAVDPREVMAWINTFKKCPPENWTPDPKNNPGWEPTNVNGKTAYTFPYPLKNNGDTKATVEPFWVSAMTIRNEQWEWFDPSHWFRRDRHSREDSQGVNNVSWYMCALYAVWLSKSLESYTATNGGKGGDGGGMQPNRFRLLNEVEWEFMARGGGNEEFPRRKDGKPVSITTKMGIGRTRGAMGDELNDVDQFSNAIEIVYPIGELWNWTGNLYQDPFGNSPKGALEWPSVGSFLSLRGASFGNEIARISYRNLDQPHYLYFNGGFRLYGSFVAAPSDL